MIWGHMLTRLKIRPKMRQIKLTIIQSANYANCGQNDQGDYMTGITKLTGVTRLIGVTRLSRMTRRANVTKVTRLNRLNRLTRRTRQTFPPDRIRERWCKNCQTCEIDNLQFRSVSESVSQSACYDHQCKRCQRI